jgi:hypothetical protein
LPRGPLIGPGEDLERVSPEPAEQPFSPDRAIVFWRDGEQFVKSLAPATEAIARRLAAVRRLEGGDLFRLAAVAMTRLALRLRGSPRSLET